MTTAIATCGWSRSTSTVDRRRLDRRSGHQREQVRHLRELLRGGAHGLVYLAAHVAERNPPARHWQPSLGKQLVDVEAVAAVGGDPAGRGVRVLEQPGLLEPRQLGAHGRRPPRHVVLLGDPLGADRLVDVDVRLDQLAQDHALARGDLHGLEFSRLGARLPRF
jgi:hypothetical protein